MNQYLKRYGNHDQLSNCSVMIKLEFDLKKEVKAINKFCKVVPIKTVTYYYNHKLKQYMQ